MSLKGREWDRFSNAVSEHINNYVVPQYGDIPNDEVSREYTAEDCVKQAKKYLARFGTGQRGPEEALRDMLKAAHYAQRAWSKMQGLV